MVDYIGGVLFSVHPTSVLVKLSPTADCRNGCSSVLCISFRTKEESWKIQKPVD